MPNHCQKCGQKFGIKQGTHDAYYYKNKWICPECYFKAKPEKRDQREGRRGYSWGT